MTVRTEEEIRKILAQCRADKEMDMKAEQYWLVAMDDDWIDCLEWVLKERELGA